MLVFDGKVSICKKDILKYNERDKLTMISFYKDEIKVGLNNISNYQ